MRMTTMKTSWTKPDPAGPPQAGCSDLAAGGFAPDGSEHPTITALEPQRRRPERLSVFLNGEFHLGIQREVAAGLGLAVGQTVSAEQLEALAAAEERRRARGRALELLALRPWGTRELERRLERHGFASDLVETVVCSLREAGLLDDREFARSWVEARAGQRLLGRARLAAELSGKGIERDLRDEALSRVDTAQEREHALAFAVRRAATMAGAPPTEVRRRLAGALRRRGFDWDTCAGVLQQVAGEHSDPT
jgi:regulatory protein